MAFEIPRDIITLFGLDRIHRLRVYVINGMSWLHVTTTKTLTRLRSNFLDIFNKASTSASLLYTFETKNALVVKKYIYFLVIMSSLV